MPEKCGIRVFVDLETTVILLDVVVWEKLLVTVSPTKGRVVTTTTEKPRKLATCFVVVLSGPAWRKSAYE